MNVVERAAPEQALEESEARYRRLVETMNEGLGVLDRTDRFTYVNPRLAKMLGYSAGDMIGHPIAEFFEGDNARIIVNQLARRRLGEELPYTIAWRQKDGRDLHTLVAPAATFSGSGEYQGSIAVVTDITEQTRARQLLEQRVTDRSHELSILLDISQVVVGTLELEPLLQVILEKLKSVVDFSGAAIFSLADRQLTTLNFHVSFEPLKLAQIARYLAEILQTTDVFSRNEALIIPDTQADTVEGHQYRAAIASMLGDSLAEFHSWMGISLRVKQGLIGLLSLHHRQPSYYTPEMGRLAVAFANQAAVAIENSRLYREAQTLAKVSERDRLARELHDSVTQSLYSLSLYADATRLALNRDKIEVANRKLDEMKAIAHEGMANLRLLIFELRPPILEEDGLVSALQSRLQAVEARVGCQTELHVEGEPEFLPEVETELYWAVNEALNNILKHSLASHVSLDLQFANGSSAITIRDDGIGFDSSRLDLHTGMGFKTITERIERIGGSFTIESSVGQGTILQVNLGQHG